MATVQEIMKGRKKEELAEEIIRLQTALEQSEYGAAQMMKHKDKEISELMLQIKSKAEEYKRWKEYHGEFVRRIIGEYMADYKDDIAEAAADHIVKNLSLEDKTVGDYYSSGTDIRLTYRGEVIGSAYVQS